MFSLAAKTVLVTGAGSVVAFLQKWDEFLLPLISLRDQKLFTTGVSLINLDSEAVKQWDQIMAALGIWVGR